MEKLKRRHERHDFSASAKITDLSGTEIQARLSNISLGGCRLLTDRTVSIAAEVTIRILAVDGDLEAPAKVVHSSDAGTHVMFGKLYKNGLLRRGISKKV